MQLIRNSRILSHLKPNPMYRQAPLPSSTRYDELLDAQDVDLYVWYDVMDGNGLIRDGNTIQYVGLTKDGRLSFISESDYDEMGINITMEQASKIILLPTIF